MLKHLKTFEAFISEDLVKAAAGEEEGTEKKAEDEETPEDKKGESKGKQKEKEGEEKPVGESEVIYSLIDGVCYAINDEHDRQKVSMSYCR